MMTPEANWGVCDEANLLDLCFEHMLAEDAQCAGLPDLTCDSDFRVGIATVVDACLHPEHDQPCRICLAPPVDRDVCSYELIGCDGKKNGSKLLRTRMANSRQWSDPMARRDAAKIAYAKGFKRLGKALTDGRSADLRKEDMLILAGMWGLRSNIWRRRGPALPPDSPGAKRQPSGSPLSPSGNRSNLSGAAAGPGPAAAAASFMLERTALDATAEPGNLLLALHVNTLPRLQDIGEGVVRVHISVAQDITPLFPRANILCKEMVAACRNVVFRSRPGFGCALELLRTNTARRELLTQLPTPANAPPEPADHLGVEAFISVIQDAFSTLRDRMVAAKGKRAAAVAAGSCVLDPAMERWEDGYLHNFSSQVEIMGQLLRVLGLARAQDLSVRETYITYLQVVTATLDFIYAYNTRLGGALLLRADWVEAQIGAEEGEGAEGGRAEAEAEAEGPRAADPPAGSLACLNMFGELLEANLGKVIPRAAAAMAAGKALAAAPAR